MSRHSNLLWITGLALGWLFDLLFWKQPFGINFAIYSLVCVLAGVILLWVNRQKPARGAIWLIGLIAVVAAVTCIRAEPMTVFLSVAFTLFLNKVLGPKPRSSAVKLEAFELAHGDDRVGVGIDRADVVALAQEVHEVSSGAAARIEHLASRGDPSAQDLIEEIDVDRAEERREIIAGSVVAGVYEKEVDRESALDLVRHGID